MPAMTLTIPTIAPPRFAVGLPVWINGYTGLLRPGGKVYAEDADGWSRACERSITGVRLIPESEEGDGPDGEFLHTLTHPSGWEYLIGTPADPDSWGWEREADLIEAGY